MSSKKKLQLGKIYTRGGDKGTTALVGGNRISKASFKLDCYGTVDELNSFIGVIRTVALNVEQQSEEVYRESMEVFRVIQNRLFDVGSILATPHDQPYEGMPEIKDDDVTLLEEKIDAYNEILEKLPSFTLPGGGLLNAHAHVARTVCRRLERMLVKLVDEEPVPDGIRKYINRLSDFLFVYSRWVAQKLGEKEFLWDKPLSS